MQVSGAVQELERRFQEMRERAEKAEGLVRMYEAREEARAVADAATKKEKWLLSFGIDGNPPATMSMAPGLFLLGVAEDFLRHPRPFELRIEHAPEKPAPPPSEKATP